MVVAGQLPNTGFVAVRARCSGRIAQQVPVSETDFDAGCVVEAAAAAVAARRTVGVHCQALQTWTASRFPAQHWRLKRFEKHQVASTGYLLSETRFVQTGLYSWVVRTRFVATCVVETGCDSLVVAHMEGNG